jgi:hypothetical protein
LITGIAKFSSSIRAIQADFTERPGEVREKFHLYRYIMFYNVL